MAWRWAEDVRPSDEEVRRPVVGDDLVPDAAVVMDRGFTVPAPPAQVWPWLVQLGKRRAGWYLPRPVERLVPPSRRALRRIEPQWQDLAVGDVVPDYGRREDWFRAEVVDPSRALVYSSRRGHTAVSWAISLAADPGGTRVHLRLRLAPVKHRLLARTVGGVFDLLTIAGLAAGLRERVSPN